MGRPVVVIVGAPPWAEAVAATLDREGFAPAHYEQQAGYVSRLATDQAALILVDGEASGWRFWVVTPKTSPATRRVPLAVVSDDVRTRQAALEYGADLALPAQALLARLPALLAEHARRPDPAHRAELGAACADSLPPQALEAVRLFNAGEFYRQHDLLEALWVAARGPVRGLYRGILQVGVAYHHITQGNRQGALKMLLCSVQWLAPLPDVCQGVDVRGLREDAARVRAALEVTDPTDMPRFDLSLLRPVRLVGQDPPAQSTPH